VVFPKRISALLLALLTILAMSVFLGLALITFRMVEIHGQLETLGNNALPRLVKISQLSQEASATISIAPALSARPGRFEFETLISRIRDKEASQRTLTEELSALIRDEGASGDLRESGNLLAENLDALTEVVRRQIDVRKAIEGYVDFLRAIVKPTPRADAASGQESARETQDASQPPGADERAGLLAYRILYTLLDPNSARLPRNRRGVDAEFESLMSSLGERERALVMQGGEDFSPHLRLANYWRVNGDEIIADKQRELANEFKIKALVEENSLIANRLLSSASSAFWHANNDLASRVDVVDRTIRLTLGLMVLVVIVFAVGNFTVWVVLKRRVFERLDAIRDALHRFADDRERPREDTRDDEIGSISASLLHYMDVINEREEQLAEKTGSLEQLSNQLAKYLSPQVYDSIFSGKQEVKVASSRKKLTVFFSDIAGFTETADRLESEELSQLLNHYLTEMSDIALAHGATIDKYVGDAILAFFGDPDTRGFKEDAVACVTMAIAMQKRIAELADVWRAAGIEKPLRARMGVNTGYCTVGNFGSESRMDYTIVGGAVNTASRLEGLAEPGEILLSYETFALIRDEIYCVEEGEIDVKGIAYPVTIYRVVDTRANLQHRGAISESHPFLSIDLDAGKMTGSDRKLARRVLERALHLLDGPGAEEASNEQEDSASEKGRSHPEPKYDSRN
jgi:class 3 adenylate cyclase